MMLGGENRTLATARLSRPTKGSLQLGAKLTDREEDDIVAFLGTLTGELPKVEYPVLPTRADSTPQPSLEK